ncbi:MAG: dTMP kinase [Sphingomonadaceae bacterium]|nr:dTMP kinase [Sphingomonadaceae bacterium]
MSGRFLSFEGGEGTGKSTQLRLLADRLRERGVEIVTTREPGGTPGADAIRALLLTGAADRWSVRAEALLMNASRADHVERLVRPCMARGAWVISDRYADSTWVYQGVGGGLAEAELRALHSVSTADLWPDLTLILDLPEGEGLARAASRAGAEMRFESKGEAFHAAVREGFRARASAEPDRCKLIDASGSVEDVAGRVWSAVAPLV